MTTSIENITNINNSLQSFREFKTEMQSAMIEKVGVDIGTDITKYPEEIRGIETGGGAMEITGSIDYLFQHPGQLAGSYNFHDCKLYQLLTKMQQSPANVVIKKPIVLDYYNNNITNTNSTSYALFYISNATYRNEFNERGLKTFFKLRNLPTAQLVGMFDGIDVNNSKIDVEFDDYYLKNNVFYLNNMFANAVGPITEIPDFLYKVLPYASSISTLNYASSSRYVPFDLEGQEITFEFAKANNTTFNYTSTSFYNFTADTVNLILHNDLTVRNTNGLFGGTGKIKNLNITGGDNSGCYIPYSSGSALADTSGNYSIENLKIHLKTGSTNQKFNFANITNSVEILPGSQFGYIQNLPYTTQEGFVGFFNSLPQKVAGSSFLYTIEIKADYYNLLTEEDMMIATNKGYTLVSV